MTLRERIADWRKFPNALGSEAQASAIVGDIASALNEDTPSEVKNALRALAIRGTMREILQAIQSIPPVRRPASDNVLDASAAASELSWTEAISILTRFFNQSLARLPQP